MARARNIKPAFFRDAKVVSVSFEARILFIGLWSIADYKGRFKYIPIELKMEIFPADNVSIEDCMDELLKSGLIQIYHDHSGVTLVQVLNFEKHQNPHINEKQNKDKTPASFLPSLLDCGVESELKSFADQHIVNSTVPAPECSGSDRADSLSLSPDPLSLIPDTGTLTPDKTLVTLKRDPANEVFKYWQEIMSHPRSAYDAKRKSVITKCLKLYSVDDLKQAIHGCSVTPHNMGDNDRGEVYDSLVNIIFKSSDQIDRFMKNSDKPPAGKVTTIQQSVDKYAAQTARIQAHMEKNK